MSQKIINRTITKSNQLIEGRYRLSLNQQRIIAILASMTHPNDKDFKEYRFSVDELCELLNTKGKKHARIKQLTKSLVEKFLQINRQDGSCLQTTWLSSADYNGGKVALCFDPKLKPYMLQLKQCFASYKLENVVRLKSKYSVRLYELLKQYQNLGQRTFKLDELHDVLGLNKNEYTRWDHFKDRVIEQAKKELPKQTDLKFSYKTKKESRKITSIIFKIKPNFPSTKKVTPETLSMLKLFADECYIDRLRKNPCTEKIENHPTQMDKCRHCKKFKS